MPAFDLIIRNGTIVDGTGAPRFAGDVAVKDGLIAQVGKVEGDASSEINAGGHVIAQAGSIFTPTTRARPLGTRKWPLHRGTASLPW